MRPALRQAKSILGHDAHVLHHSVPAFLCPALLQTPLSHPVRFAQGPPRVKPYSTVGPTPPRIRAVEAARALPDELKEAIKALPRACPGCGAASQVFDKDAAGYFNIERRQVKSWLDYEPGKESEVLEENVVYTEALRNADPALLEELGISKETLDAPTEAADAAPDTPVCDRCHNLIHHHVGTPIHHPSVDAISQTIAESPHRRNHIYHVVDAADFPLSLVPNLQSSLRIPKLRTHNRRAKHKGWVGENRIAEVSFIITRADLLAPMKEQVDTLLPYMQDVLRDALGRVNKDARLGNVHLVSAKRGWWTKKVKEDIWERGGAGWMVGKVNVGKSNLFEVVFPKGRGSDYKDIKVLRTAAEKEQMLQGTDTIEEFNRIKKQLDEEDGEIERRRRQPVMEPDEVLPEEDARDFDADSLLPQRQPYTPFPVLPLASSLPGTTASPIRVPFGRNRGELIDLPGLARSNPDLSTFVKPEEHDQLVMTNRVTPERLTIRPGQSLVLGGGLVRITPVSDDIIFLAHAFVPLRPHITATEKAIGFQTQTREGGLTSILTPDVGPKMRSAGKFKLQWDATKKLAGPLTSPVAGKMKPENLPFTVWSTDILIEGVGWVEISAQTRKQRGWKPVGMVKKDPNHARIERDRKMREERERKQAKWAPEDKDSDAAKEKEKPTPAVKEDGDAFDRMGMGGGDRDRGRANRYGDRRSDRDTDEHNTRDRKREDAADFVDDMVQPYPEIEVFTPLGKYIGARRPMCGSLLGGPKYVSVRGRQARPRRAMAPVRGKQMSERKTVRRTTSG